MEAQQLSKWFYLGIAGIVIGAVLIYLARGQNKNKLMENGYFILILGLVGIISEWTDFAAVLFIFVVVCIVTIIVDKLFLAKRYTVKPHYIYYAREFLPVVFAVWILRAFLFEAYQIPSSSMRPNLTVGDFILVNKFNYGIREPFTNRVLFEINRVKRGDVVVFKDQTVKNRDLIKRVVGVGGDKIEYYNKRLKINGVNLKYTANGYYDYTDNFSQGDITFHNEMFNEDLLGVKHFIITWDRVPAVINEDVANFPGRENCTYTNDGFTCIVPQGKYFMMGDNRDNSKDSRYWGFAPDEAILGKAIYVLINFHDMKRKLIKI